jgi:hypothetical protein
MERDKWEVSNENEVLANSNKKIVIPARGYPGKAPEALPRSSEKMTMDYVDERQDWGRDKSPQAHFGNPSAHRPGPRPEELNRNCRGRGNFAASPLRKGRNASDNKGRQQVYREDGKRQAEKIFIPPREHEKVNNYGEMNQIAQKRVFPAEPAMKRQPLINCKSQVFGKPDAFNMQKEPLNNVLSNKIQMFTQMCPDINPLEVRRIIFENQNRDDDFICNKLMQFSATPRPSQNIFKMEAYKTHPCPNLRECTEKNCIFYHFLGERRRFPIKYTPELCNNPNCDAGEDCRKAHNMTEVYYHNQVCRSMPCPFEKCPFAECCMFQHLNQNKERELVEKLNNELERCKEKKEKTIEEKNCVEEEERKYLEYKDELNRRVRCGVCKNFRIGVVIIPCVHSVCVACVKGTLCPVCGKKFGKTIKLIFDD